MYCKYIVKTIVCKLVLLGLNELLTTLENLKKQLCVLPAAFPKQHLQSLQRRGIDGKIAVEPVHRADGFHEALAEKSLVREPVPHACGGADGHWRNPTGSSKAYQADK